MRWIIGIIVLVVAAIGIVLVVTGGDSKADKAMAQVCDARADIAEQVDTLQGLTLATATTSQISESVQAIRDDLTKIAEARVDLAEENREQVEAANEKFTETVRETVSTVARTVSAEEAAGQLEAALNKLATSYQETYGTVECE